MFVSSIIYPLLEDSEALFQILIWPFTTAWDVLSQIFTGDIPGAIDTFVSAISTQFTNVVNFVSSMGETLLNYMTWPWRAALDLIYEMLPSGIKDTVDEAWAFVTGVFDQASDLGYAIVDGIVEGMTQLGNRLVEIGEEAWDSVTGFFGISSPSKKAGEMGDNIVNGMMDSMNAIPHKMFEVFKKGLDIVLAIFGLEGLMPIVHNILDVMKNVAQSITKIFKVMGVKMIQPLMDTFNSVKQFIVDVFSGKSIKESFMKMAVNVKISVMEMVDIFRKFLPYIVDVISQTFERIWNLVTDVINFEKFGAQLQTVINAMMDWAKAVVDVLFFPFIKAYDKIAGLFNMPTFDQIFAMVREGINAGVDTLIDILTSPFDSAVDKIKSIFSFGKMKEMAANVVSGFMDGMADMVPDVGELAGKAMDGLADMFGIASKSKKAAEFGGFFTGGLLDGMGEMETEVSKIGEKAMGAIGSIFGSDKPTATGLVDAVVGPITSTVDSLLGAQNTIHEVLNNLKPIDLAAEVERVADQLVVKNKTVKVQSKPVNITVNLAVTMEAEDVARALVEGKWVAQGDNMTPPGQ